MKFRAEIRDPDEPYLRFGYIGVFPEDGFEPVAIFPIEEDNSKIAEEHARIFIVAMGGHVS